MKLDNCSVTKSKELDFYYWKLW